MTAVRTPDELRTLAREAEERLADAPAQDVAAWAARTFGRRLAVTSSMADAVVAHLVSKAAPGVDVLFLDTGYHFPETIGTRDAVAVTVDVTIRTVRPQQSVEVQDATLGPRLYERNPDLCCALRKVAPLDRALADYDAWITGLRRSESPTRADTPVVDFDERRGKVKINPIAAWSDDEVEAYVADHGIVINPLLYDGYTSIGCGPCTARPRPGQDARAGRWAGLSKVECGIHV